MLLQEKKRLTQMMQEKMRKKITSIVDDMSLHCENQKTDEACALETSTETSDGKPFTIPNTHSAFKINVPPKDPNMLTFSKQKLALIQCEYDPKSCSCCKKSESLVQLKNCAGCKTAKYCSKDCQVKDWMKNHKTHCKEIQRLNLVVDGTKQTIHERHGKIPRELMQAKKLDGEWSLDTRLMYSNILLLENVLILLGSCTNVAPILTMHDAFNGRDEQVICRLNLKELTPGICAMKIGNARYVAISRALCKGGLNLDSRLEFWSISQSESHPVYVHRDGTQSIGSLHFGNGHLYAADSMGCEITEYNVSSFPIKSTGLIIQPQQRGLFMVDFCTVKEHKNLKLILHFEDTTAQLGLVVCVDSRGHHLWEVKSQPLDGILFYPWSICSNHDGHIFMSDRNNARIVTLDQNHEMRHFMRSPGKIVGIAWCEITDKLLVVSSNQSKGQITVSRFDLFGQ